MTVPQKVILIALLAIGALCLIVGFALMHHIGGFMRTVEEEAREQELSREKEVEDSAPSDGDNDGKNNSEYRRKP